MTGRYHQICLVVQQLDALNELTSLFAIGSDAGNSLMIDIRSSAKIRNYASPYSDSCRAKYGQVQMQAVKSVHREVLTIFLNW